MFDFGENTLIIEYNENAKREGKQEMTTYINKHWNENGRKRNDSYTNVCFAVTVDESAKLAKPEYWEETEESIYSNMTFLFSESGTEYYGYL